MKIVWQAVGLAVVIVLALLVCAGGAAVINDTLGRLHGAPVPAAKKPSMLGTWECCWYSYVHTGEMNFAADGSYHHKYRDGGLYVGTWWERDGVLFVRERYVPANPAEPPGEWKDWNTNQGWCPKAASCKGTAEGDYGTVVWGIRNRKK